MVEREYHRQAARLYRQLAQANAGLAELARRQEWQRLFSQRAAEAENYARYHERQADEKTAAR
jgi:3-deoxy-D-arabino-heptulosonate 7-phosphate (DAHP) synthase class II